MLNDKEIAIEAHLKTIEGQEGEMQKLENELSASKTSLEEARKDYESRIESQSKQIV